MSSSQSVTGFAAGIVKFCVALFLVIAGGSCALTTCAAVALKVSAP